MADRKGFVFTVLALTVLMLVILSVNVWVRTFEAAEDRASERFKGEALRSIIHAVSDDSLSDFARASAFYATYKLANHTSGNNMGIAPSSCSAVNDGYLENPCTGNIEKYGKSLMENGTPPSIFSPPNAIYYTTEENLSYTITSWRARVSQSAWLMGFNVTFAGPYNFTYKQIDPWNVLVRFELDMNISDLAGTMRQTRRGTALATFPINGFADPMVSRNEYSLHINTIGTPLLSAAIKQVFTHSAYASPANVAPVQFSPTATSDAPEGYGWFFGPTTSDLPGTGIFSPDIEHPQNPKQYILRDSYNPDMPLYANEFGGVIVTTEPNTVQYSYIHPLTGCIYNVTEQSNCLNCMRFYETNIPACSALSPDIISNQVSVPMVVATNLPYPASVFRLGTFPETQQFLLIDNENSNPQSKLYGYHRVWDVTAVRDMAICGFYVHDANKPAPSFFQRMLAGTPFNPQQRSADLGIESFVLGKWAGGEDDRNAGGNYPTDAYSRLDYEFYGQDPWLGVYRLKGMPGCKSESMCTSPDPTVNGTGKFRLTTDSATRYGMQNLRLGVGGPLPD